LDKETALAGKFCGVGSDYLTPCCLSINAFGLDQVNGYTEIPDWMHGKATDAHFSIPPATAFTWCYEDMYGDEVKTNGFFDNKKRLEKAQAYFDSFEPDKSLVFYYANYSNPFTDDETNRYVIVGMSRLKEIGEFFKYDNLDARLTRDKFTATAWQKPVTSHYPEQSFRIPYEKYMDNEEIVKQISFIPQNTRPFKFGTRAASDDEAIQIVSRFIEIADYLISIEDQTDDWRTRKEWLGTLLNELWLSRGAYPGIPAILDYLNLSSLILPYLKLVTKGNSKATLSELSDFLIGGKNSLYGINVDAEQTSKVRKQYELLNKDQKEFLLHIAPRFSLTAEQLTCIIPEERASNGIQSSLRDIIENPYIISEEFIPNDSDSAVTIYMIDNGVLPFPGFGIDNVLSVDSAQRLRAFTVMELTIIAAHSFTSVDYLLKHINAKLNAMPEWKKVTYSEKSYALKSDQDFYKQTLFMREDESILYLYLDNNYQDERFVEAAISELATRPLIKTKQPASAEMFKDRIVVNEVLQSKDEGEYERIINSQADVCAQIFNKPISVLSGAAGTGKTTVLKAIVETIKHLSGEGTPIVIMTPTGKATERVKIQTGRSATTIHTWLAQREWIGDNYIFKRNGGKRETRIDTLIIDECSMIDLTLFAVLLKSIDLNSLRRLILVGDPNQLPPIGRGRLFSEIIEHLKETHPENVGVLKENVRQFSNRVQGRGNGILDFADIYIQEKQRDAYETKSVKESLFARLQNAGDFDGDLSVQYWSDIDELESKLQSIMKSDMEDDIGEEFDEDKLNLLWDKATKLDSGGRYRMATYSQVISPYRGERYGTDNINHILQNMLNGKFAAINQLEGIAVGDKVIQYINRPPSNPAYAYDPQKKAITREVVYNGEIGFVRPHNLT
jgi:energy-coupling factor transporter ATP-binding protein EcfA2